MWTETKGAAIVRPPFRECIVSGAIIAAHVAADL